MNVLFSIGRIDDGAAQSPANPGNITISDALVRI